MEKKSNTPEILIKNISVAQEEVSLKEVVIKFVSWTKYLLTRWKLILLFALVGATLGYFYAKSVKVKYVASLTFALEDNNDRGGLSQYGGLASIVGIDVTGGGGYGIFQGDNLIELYKSRRMIEKALLSKVKINGKDEILIEQYISLNKLRQEWNKKSALRNIQFTDSAHFQIKQDSIINNIVDDINQTYLNVSKLDKKTSIIKVEVSSGDEQFSKNFAQQIVSTVNNFYVQTKTKKSLNNLSILQHQADSIRGVFNGAISNVAASIDANPNINISRQVLRVPSQQRQVSVEANKAIFSELVKNLEVAKISLRRETPLIQVIDEPVYPLPKRGFGRLKGMIIGGFLFGFLTTIYLTVTLILKNIFSNE